MAPSYYQGTSPDIHLARSGRSGFLGGGVAMTDSSPGYSLPTTPMSGMHPSLFPG